MARFVDTVRAQHDAKLVEDLRRHVQTCVTTAIPDTDKNCRVWIHIGQGYSKNVLDQLQRVINEEDGLTGGYQMRCPRATTSSLENRCTSGVDCECVKIGDGDVWLNVSWKRLK